MAPEEMALRFRQLTEEADAAAPPLDLTGLGRKQKQRKRKSRREKRKIYSREMQKIAKDYISSYPFAEAVKKYRKEIVSRTVRSVDQYILHRLDVIIVGMKTPDSQYIQYAPLDVDNWNELMGQDFDRFLERLVSVLELSGVGQISSAILVLAEQEPFFSDLLSSEDVGDYTADRMCRKLRTVIKESEDRKFVFRHYDRERVQNLLSRSDHFAGLVKEVGEKRKRVSAIRTGILEGIPEHYPDLFPLAREMERRFIIHVGPTNSGKTYEAIEALKRAESGVYLAPLRLLAYEQYENLNNAGAACTLVTGEERRVTEGAWIRSSTIEMLDYKHWYDVAVIDEAQMMTDSDRGGSWTAAIMGVRAEEIHVCTAPSAEKLVKRLIEDCGDTYTVTYHERMTPLTFENMEFRFPEGVRSGDGLIVFSRRDVHAVAAELQRIGKKCSIIYGALPYDVRYEEARKFREGETEIVVATDAIGMGLNMPVCRIVFLKDEKFDGREKRPLRAPEVQQIAGRAGRYGMYGEGLVNALYNWREIKEDLETKVPDDEEAVIAFPEELLRIDAPLSEILTQWAEMEVSEGFRKDLSETEIQLSRRLEQLSDDKYLIYRFVTMAFDEKDENLIAMWEKMFEYESGMHRAPDGLPEDFPYSLFLPSGIPESGTSDDLPYLEQSFHVCDLLYGYMDRFAHPDGIPDVLACKEKLSKAIMEILDRQELDRRRCRECGRPLSWIYPYAICDRCYTRKRYRRKR